MLIEIFFDGACMTGGQKNDETGLGVAVYIDKDYSPVFSTNLKGDKGSNNTAEWCASIEALKVAKLMKELCNQEKIKPLIRIYGDSQLIVNQFNGNFDIKHPSFVKYFTQAKQIANEINFKWLRWIPREKNKQADRLSKIALGKKTTLKDILIMPDLN